MLRDGTIDKDMLDEQARRALNLSHVDEVTIMLPLPLRLTDFRFMADIASDLKRLACFWLYGFMSAMHFLRMAER